MALIGADKEEKTIELLVPIAVIEDKAEMLKEYRRRHHLKQAELAERIGVNPLTLRSWEQKQSKPPYHVWRRFKNMLE